MSTPTQACKNQNNNNTNNNNTILAETLIINTEADPETGGQNPEVSRENKDLLELQRRQRSPNKSEPSVFANPSLNMNVKKQETLASIEEAETGSKDSAAVSPEARYVQNTDDKDGDGTNEVQQVQPKNVHLENKQTSPGDIKILKKLFHEDLDFNNNGKLSLGEFRFILYPLERNGYITTDDEFYAAFLKFDVNKQNHIVLDEILYIVASEFLVLKDRTKASAYELILSVAREEVRLSRLNDAPKDTKEGSMMKNMTHEERMEYKRKQKEKFEKYLREKGRLKSSGGSEEGNPIGLKTGEQGWIDAICSCEFYCGLIWISSAFVLLCVFFVLMVLRENGWRFGFWTVVLLLLLYLWYWSCSFVMLDGAIEKGTVSRAPF